MRSNAVEQGENGQHNLTRNRSPPKTDNHNTISNQKLRPSEPSVSALQASGSFTGKFSHNPTTTPPSGKDKNWREMVREDEPWPRASVSSRPARPPPRAAPGPPYGAPPPPPPTSALDCQNTQTFISGPYNKHREKPSPGRRRGAPHGRRAPAPANGNGVRLLVRGSGRV